MVKYAEGLKERADMRERRCKVEEQAAIMEQVITLSAVNHSTTFTATPQLVEAMINEAAKLRGELATIVGIPHLIKNIF